MLSCILESIWEVFHDTTSEPFYDLGTALRPFLLLMSSFILENTLYIFRHFSVFFYTCSIDIWDKNFLTFANRPMWPSPIHELSLVVSIFDLIVDLRDITLFWYPSLRLPTLIEANSRSPFSIFNSYLKSVFIDIYSTPYYCRSLKFPIIFRPQKKKKLLLMLLFPFLKVKRLYNICSEKIWTPRNIELCMIITEIRFRLFSVTAGLTNWLKM